MVKIEDFWHKKRRFGK